jgi:hypothetical protein
MRKHACQLGFIIDGENQGRRYEDVSTRKGKSFMSAPAHVVANHREFPIQIRDAQLRSQPPAQPLQVIVDCRIGYRRRLFAHLGCQACAESSPFLLAVEIDIAVRGGLRAQASRNQR